MLAKSSEYGIRATLYVASLSREGFVPIREISEKTDISFHYLTKVLQTLAGDKIVTSLRGSKGGVRLARPPEEITLLDVVRAFEGPEVFKGCLLGLPQCDDGHPCVLHDSWNKVRDILFTVFERTNLQQLLDRIEKENLRFYDSRSIEQQEHPE